MMLQHLIPLSVAALLSWGTAAATNQTRPYQGFNSGSTYDNYTAKYQADFEHEFRTAQNLIGTNASRNYTFSSTRLYTMVQAYTSHDVISAVPAAIATNTTMLLGMWASAGQDSFNNELAALQGAIDQYGQPFIDLIAGISVGSEDMYRRTPTGIENNSGPGADPDVLVQYITEVRNVLANSNLSHLLVGHVDTWTAWVNSSNDAVINACDFIGMDGYPYFQTVMDNSIQNGPTEFWDSYNQTVHAVKALGGKQPVWITETGWPVSGPNSNAAVASVANAQYYWNQVGCPAFGNISTWWFTMQDANPNTPSPSFGIVAGPTLTTQPLYNISCQF